MSPADPDDPFQTTKRSAEPAPTDPNDRTTVARAEPPAAADATVTAGVPPEPPVAPPGAGPVVPGYELLGVLGRGGMGVVYQARQVALKRTVALKMILAGGHAGAHELARFRTEAEAVARLQHPNIVQIHEVGESAGFPYCALEFVDGGTLAEKLSGEPLTPAAAAGLVETLARAMHLAHSRNVVHRDLKPANVLLTAAGVPKITDFGLARQLDADSSETQAGAVMGTPAYMAPEQAGGRSHEAGPLADVYSLGAILYECLAGRPPFRGDTVVATLDLVRTADPAPPSRWRAKLPPDLDTVALKCLRKEPERRYASAAELADELKRYRRGEPVLARPVGRGERAWRWCRRNPALTTAAAAVVLALVGGAAVSGHYAVRANENARAADANARAADANADRADEKARQAERSAAAAAESASRATRLAAYAGSQRDTALESFNALLTEVQERLADTPEMRQVRDRLVDAAARGLDRLADTPAGDLGPDRGLADARLRLAHSFESLGNRAAARKQYEAALRALDAAARETPTDRSTAVAAASARSDLGALVATADRAAGRALLVAAAGALDAVLAADPAEPAARQARAVAAGRLGRHLATDGDRAGGGREFDRSLALRAELASAAPADPARQLALAEAHQALGEFLVPDDLSRAGGLIEKADALAAAVAAKDPNDRAAKLRLASIALARGTVFERTKLFGLANPLYRRAYQLQLEVLAVEPHNAAVRFAAVGTCRKLSDLFTRIGDRGLARDFAVTAFRRMTPVLAADPDNPTYLRATRDIHRQAAALSTQWKGLIGARNHLRQALDYTHKLAASDPADAEFQRDQLALARELADLSLKLGHRAGARDYLAQAQAAARRLNDADAVAALGARLEVTTGPDERFTVNSIGLDLVPVAAGSFTRGSEESADAVVKEFGESRQPFAYEHPAHEVRISRPLLFGATEVTRGQFRAFVTATGYRTEAERDGEGVTQFTTATGSRDRQMENWRAEGFAGLSEDHPVVGVTWDDAVAFCAWLSKKEGRTYRLPTEAEWEYACRAGTTTRYWTGNDPESLATGANVPDQSFRENRGNQGYAVLAARDGYGEAAPVGEFAANPFGLYDMHGNVWELCRDGWDPAFYEKKVRDNPVAPDRPAHTIRGGCFL